MSDYKPPRPEDIEEAIAVMIDDEKKSIERHGLIREVVLKYDGKTICRTRKRFLEDLAFNKPIPPVDKDEERKHYTQSWTLSDSSYAWVVNPGEHHVANWKHGSPPSDQRFSLVEFDKLDRRNGLLAKDRIEYLKSFIKDGTHHLAMDVIRNVGAYGPVWKVLFEDSPHHGVNYLFQNHLKQVIQTFGIYAR